MNLPYIDSRAVEKWLLSHYYTRAAGGCRWNFTKFDKVGVCWSSDYLPLNDVVISMISRSEKIPREILLGLLQSETSRITIGVHGKN